MILPTLKVEVELSAGTWTDITSDVTRDMRASRGIPGNVATARIAKEGKLKFYLKNSASNSAGLEGYYSLDHANKRSGWGRGKKVRVFMSHSSYQGGADQPVFYGKITAIRPTAGKTGPREVYVEVTDFIADLNDYDQLPQTALLQNVNSDQAYQQVIDDMSVRPVGTNFISEYLLYDGAETYTVITDSAFDNLTTADFTVEGWFKLDSLGESNVGHFFAKGNLASGGWRFWSNSETSLAVQTAFSVTSINHGFGVLDDYVDGTFKHFAFQWDATAKQWELWINGEYIGTDTSGGASGTPDDDSGFDFYIGASSSGGALSMDGAVGWCRLSTVKRYTTSVDFDAKTKEDIPSLDDDTLALWRFIDGDGTTASDATGNYDGSITSGTWRGNRRALDELPFVFQRSGERSGTAFEEFNRIALSVFDRMYVRGDGYLVKQGRSDTIDEVTIQHTFNSDLVGVDHDDDRSRVVDRVISTTHPLTVAAGQDSTVYSIENPIRLNPGETKSFVARYTDPATSRVCSLVDPVTPVADTHYKFSSTPNSEVGDYNDNLTVSVTFNSGSASVSVTNDGNAVGWINQFDLVGNKVTFIESVETIKTITAGQQKTIRVDMPYQQDANFASAANNMIGNVYGSNSKRKDNVRYYANSNSTTLAAFFNTDVGKRIAVTEIVTGLSASEAFVQKVDWTFYRGQHLEASYLLSPARDTSDRAIVGTSKVGSGVIYFSGG